MIDKIIIQDSTEVQSEWLPDRRSFASFAIWKAFGIDLRGNWKHGHITLGVSGECDHRMLAEFPPNVDHGAIPTWVAGCIAEVDSILPCQALIAAALDADSITIGLDPPAFRIPESPGIEDAAICVVAGRMLFRISDQLVLPTQVERDELVGLIDFASRLAMAAGGKAAAEKAVSLAGHHELCAILPETGDNDDLIVVEEPH